MLPTFAFSLDLPGYLDQRRALRARRQEMGWGEAAGIVRQLGTGAEPGGNGRAVEDEEMFEGLQQKLDRAFRRLRGGGRVSADDVQHALREIRVALLEADVHVRVVKGLLERVSQRALGQEVLLSLSPDQQVIKIVRDELQELLGAPASELDLQGAPAVVVLCGLQGSGKTTTAGKLARRLRERGRHRPVLVACDLQRAAAIVQLVQVGRAVSVPVLQPEPGEGVVPFAARALQAAASGGFDVAIFDTAGRLHVDQTLMDELASVVASVSPSELLFVCDAMTGQDAVRSATQFAAALPLTGAILTKLDGDARGGAALSLRAVSSLPLRFVGVGEKAEELELFSPDRLVSRILGMGDVLSLIEKAEQAIDRDSAERLARRLAEDEFTLEDLRDQLRSLRRMGPLQQILDLLPRTGPLKGLPGAVSELDERRLVAVEALINSMTPAERRRPALLDGGRKRRIARGSGRSLSELNQLLKQYKQMRKMMRKMQGGFLRGALGR